MNTPFDEEFELLYRANFKRLAQKAWRITLDKEAAEDIVQEAFLKLWRGQREAIEFKESYLYRSVINGALNYIRQRKRSDRLPDDISIAADRTPLADLQSRELQNSIQQAINSLPERCREVFLLSRYEEMSYREIADFLSISVNTVEKQIGKALEILRGKISF